MKAYIEAILNVPASDPDDSRRRRLLNILILGTVAAALSGLAAILIDSLFTRSMTSTDRQLLLAGILLITIGISGIYYVNRRYSGQWAALLYLLLLTLIFTFSDRPEYLAGGRSLFVYTIPIAISSLILFPLASFIFAALSSVIIVALANSVAIVPNSTGIIGFFMLALVSWLSARSLDQALKELRAVNASLDQVVIERTQALAETLERERIEAGRHQAILNSIADGVMLFDPNWNAILANPALKSMLDLPIEQIVNKNLRDLIEHPRLSAPSQALLRAMMERDTQPPGFRIVWGEKTLSISAAQVYDIQNDIPANIGTVTVFRDFTREAEVEKLKSSFVAMVSHELRTPLNAILGYAEMFKEAVYGPMNEKQINMADRVIRNTQRLLGLINDLLDQAQMEAGRLTIQMRPVRPAELLENLHSVMDQIVHAKRLDLTVAIDENLPETLQGDAARLQQILVNLVNNGIKFTDHGAVHVRLFCSSPNRWSMQVSDTGRGIPESEIPHIFDTFRQVDAAATRVHGGFGLGLAIVRQLVHLMHGDIQVNSNVDGGSTFTVTLPLVVTVTEEKKGEGV
jgi:signal transduction histidine kinase